MQVGVFSATLPPEALEITRKFMNKPVSSSRISHEGQHGALLSFENFMSCGHYANVLHFDVAV